MSKFSNNHFARNLFYQWDEKDIMIYCLGYHDFHIAKPNLHISKQKYYTLHIILNGSGTLYLNGKHYKLSAHDMFYVPSKTEYMYYPDEDNLWDYVWFSFGGEMSDKYMKKMGLSLENPYKKAGGYDNIFKDLAVIFDKLNNNQNSGYYEILSAFYNMIDLNLVEVIPDNDDFVELAKKYITNQSYMANITIKEISESLNVSRSWLCKKFKEEYGVSLVGYLISVRIEKACEYLKYSDYSIKEIVNYVGFSDVVHFSKTFKRVKGVTPGTYRKQNKQE